MAEIDWDKIIKNAKKKKKEAEESKHIEKRLDRMERLLEKAVDSREREAIRRAYEDREREEKGKPKKAEPKVVKVRKGKRIHIGRPKLNVPKIKVDFSNKHNLVIFVVIIGAGALVALNATGKLDFTGFVSKQKTMYVCADGITTVENITMCPTTTTTTTTTTSTTSTTTTTTIPLGVDHSLAISDATCSNKIISFTLTNAGTTLENIGYLLSAPYGLYIDGERAISLSCSNLLLKSLESTSCQAVMTSTGSYDIEMRGYVQPIPEATVTC